jgi:hypothetical protein
MAVKREQKSWSGEKFCPTSFGSEEEVRDWRLGKGWFVVVGVLDWVGD